MHRTTKIIVFLICLLTLNLAFVKPGLDSATLAGNVTDDQPILNFPDSITFHATIESNAQITSVVLEYGTKELTCGSVVAKAFPEFTPGTDVAVEWTWEMKQSGSLPPGTTLWWRWRYSDENGENYLSESKTITWLDSTHAWKTISSGYINLHWYSGDQAFADELLDTSVAGLELLRTDAGLQPEGPIHLYIYGNTDDLKDAILYEPGWTGGLAYPNHDIVIIGISQNDIEWGRDAIVHELTHVLVGHLTFSCLGSVPTWLNEGLAVYSEGDLDPNSEAQLNQAISDDQLLTVRSLSGGFSEVPSKAYLSYSQSYSIVKFLIETYGQDKMNALLIALRDGTTIDDALLKVYGFDVEGLEVAWRDAIGAAPKAASAQPTAQPTPTIVPTYVPFSGSSLLVTSTPFTIPTSSANEQQIPSEDGLDFPVTLMLGIFCCGVIFLIIAAVSVWKLISSQKRQGEGHEVSA